MAVKQPFEGLKGNFSPSSVRQDPPTALPSKKRKPTQKLAEYAK